jgi:hypothetical protein
MSGEQLNKREKSWNPKVVIVASNAQLGNPLDWLIKRLIKVEARISHYARRWYVHVASAFPLAHHYRAMLARGTL